MKTYLQLTAPVKNASFWISDKDRRTAREGKEMAESLNYKAPLSLANPDLHKLRMLLGGTLLGGALGTGVGALIESGFKGSAPLNVGLAGAGLGGLLALPASTLRRYVDSNMAHDLFKDNTEERFEAIRDTLSSGDRRKLDAGKLGPVDSFVQYTEPPRDFEHARNAWSERQDMQEWARAVVKNEVKQHGGIPKIA